jgi:hypothetical protein
MDDDVGSKYMAIRAVSAQGYKGFSHSMLQPDLDRP